MHVKRRSLLGPLNVDYDVRYSDAVPPLVYRSGGSLVFSALGTWLVSRTGADDELAATDFDEVTIFKYHNRGTFLATVMGEEYGERCAPHRARGLTRSYFALTRRVC